MYIDRALLLTLALAIVFFPGIERWMFAGDEQWYRPFLVWLTLIAAVFWNQRRQDFDEL